MIYCGDEQHTRGTFQGQCGASCLLEQHATYKSVEMLLFLMFLLYLLSLWCLLCLLFLLFLLNTSPRRLSFPDVSDAIP